jgi:MFS family permease
VTSPTTTSGSTQRPPRGGLLRHRDFLKLWSAETISQFGTQVSLLAIPTVAVLLLEATPFEVALLGTIEFLPFILFSLPAGAWVDRLRRRPILIAGDLGRAISLASIPIAWYLGVLSIYQLYVVGFVNGILTVFFDVAYQSYLPSLVERDELVEGNSKLEISRTVAQTAGPALSGALIQVASAPFAILADAISFLGSALFVLGIRKREPTPDRHVDEHGQKRESLRTEVAQGLRYVLGNRYLRGIAASTGTSNFFSNVVFAVVIVYLYREVGLNPGQVGLAFGIGNIGAILGAFTANRWARWLGLGPAIVLSMAINGPAILLIPLAPPDLVLPALVASGFLAGLSAVVYNVNQVSFRQAITPVTFQGRMNATMRFIVWGTIPIGGLVGGALASIPALGVHGAIWIGAIGSLFAFVPLVITPVRTLREMPAGPEADRPTGPGEPATDAPPMETIGEALDETRLASGSTPIARQDES